jgi:hypothetical protein
MGKVYLHTIVVVEAAATATLEVATSASHAGKLFLIGDALRSIPRFNQTIFVN